MKTNQKMKQKKDNSRNSKFFSNGVQKVTTNGNKHKFTHNNKASNLLYISFEQTEKTNSNYINKANLVLKKEKFNNLSVVKFKFKTLIYNLRIINFIFLILLNQISCVEINPEYSYIILKVKGIGNKYILRSGSCTHPQPNPRLPDEVYINEEKMSNRNFYYNFANSTNNVTLIWYQPLIATGCMFLGCSDIIEMDLFHFKTSEITCFAGMFNGCSSLTSLNLSNFNTSRATSMIYLFNNCRSLISLDLSNFNTENVNDDNYIFSGCSNIEYVNLKNSVLNNNFLNQISSLSLKNIYISDKYINKLTNKFNLLTDCIIFNELNSKNENNKYYICSKEDKFLCNYFGYEFYEMINLINNSNLDNINCNEKCEKNYIYDNKKNKTYCTSSSLCPDSYTKFIPETKRCIDDCSNDKEFKYELNNICYKFFENSSYNNNSLIIYRDFLINQLNLSGLSEGIDMEMRKDNILFSFTSTNKQNNLSNDNKVSINLGKCEKILKDFYNISYNDSLYIYKVEVKLSDIKIPKIEYEVYYPLFNNILFQLNLSLCKEEKIDILIPFILKDNIEKYNPNSNYYNDICSKATSNKGTDISLNDRKEEYFEQNMTLCEEKCELINYNYSIKKIKCSCEIKKELSLIEDIKFDKNELYKRFIDIKNIINITLLKCFKNVLSKDSIKKNYGFFIFLTINILFIISTCIFYFKNYYYIIKEINEIILAKKCKKIIKRRKKIKKFNIDNNPNKRRTNKYFTNEENNNREKLKNLNLNTDSKNYSFNKFKNKNFVKLKIISEVKEKSVIEKYKNILEYNDNEINSLSYQVALKKDKRTFFQYYLSLLRVGHPFLFSFYKNRDYNAQIIKIFLFFFFFAENFTINALFFNDETIHKIYIDQGSFNFIYQIPQVIYSSLISNIIDSLIKFLALSEDNIIKLKHIKVSLKRKKKF